MLLRRRISFLNLYKDYRIGEENCMARQSTANAVNKVIRNKWGVFGLVFIGSLIYLAVTFIGVTGQQHLGYASSSWVAATLWLPILYAGAVVSSIGLLFASFGHLIHHDKAMYELRARVPMTASIVGASTLFALTAGSWGWFIAVIIGFILSFIGGAVAYIE